VKHGRIAMAATVGMLVQENYRFQGLLSPSENLSFSDVPNGLAALDVVPLLGWVQLAVLIGAHEVLVKQRPGKKPGDFGTGYLGVAMDDESSKQLRALNVEIQNGRLAMLGILGMFASENIHVSRSVLWFDDKLFFANNHFNFQGTALWETKIFS
jgi:light-harvesting complex I chlorophyll a/b binding protein 1